MTITTSPLARSFTSSAALRTVCMALLMLFVIGASAQCLTGNVAGTTYTAACSGSVETVSTTGGAGTYCNVVLTAGSIYTFASNTGTDFITIANAAGTASLAQGSSPLTFTAPSAGTYRFYIHTNGSCGTQAISRIRTLRCTVNDLVCNATPITCGSTTVGSTIQTSSTGTYEGATTCGVVQSQPGVWYRVAGLTGSTYTASLCGSAGFDSRISVYSGSCSLLTCIGGNDANGPACNGTQASFSWPSVTGTNYFIKVHGTSGTSAFSLDLDCTPANDLICNATPVTCGSSTSGTTSGATGTGTAEAGAVCGFGQSSNPAVWYRVAGSTGTNITASLCGNASWNSRIAVYSGTCAAPVCVGGNDDGTICSGTLAADYTWASTTGTTYYIKVYSTVSTSAFTLDVTCATPPPACNATYTSPANGSSTCGAPSPALLTWPGVSGATGYDVYLDNINGTTLLSSNVGDIAYQTGNLPAGTYFWRVVPRNSGGTASGCPTWSFTRSLTPTTATVGTAQTICPLGTTTSLGGNTPTVGTGAWSIVSGGTGTFSNAASGTSTFTHTGGNGPVVLRWTISNGSCTPSTANVSITVTPAPTTATVGSAQTICALGTTAALGGNTPVVGTGAWSIVSGGTGGFSSSTSPSALFTHFSGAGPVVLRWTISNGACTSAANMTVTIAQPPTTATVGSAQTICPQTTTTSLGGNTPTMGTGAWSIVSGGTGTFSNAASPTSTFTHTGGTGPVVLRWTITSAACTPSIANVSISISPAPTTATAGGPQTICESGSTTPLGANGALLGTGQWSVVSGGTGTFANTTSPNSTFTHTGGAGPIVLRWTITRGSCTSSADQNVTILPRPTTATVGPPQTICGYTTTTGLGANVPLQGTGSWSAAGGSTAGFSDPNDPNATYTDVHGGGMAYLTWSISNGLCPTSHATVDINVLPSTIQANAGPDLIMCSGAMTAPLSGSSASGGTGTWSIMSGGTGTFLPSANVPYAAFQHQTGAGPIVLRWTVTSASCFSSWDEMTITLHPVPVVAAGPAQTICSLGTATLAANTPALGTGTWTLVGGGTGTFSNVNEPNATFTHTSGAGPVVLRWTVQNGCTSSSQQMSVIIAPPVTTGAAQSICTNGTSTALGGSTTSGGSGTWSVVSGGTGTFSNVAAANATFTHTGGAGPITLRWTYTAGQCTASANVNMTILPAPTTAVAAAPQTICALSATTGLGGNTPTTGTGMWSIVSGGTGTFSNANTPNATFTHTGGNGPVVLRWTISNGTCVSFANTTITITPTPTTATVGGPQTMCAGGMSETLGGNVPTVGNGAWSIVSGGTGTFTNPTSAASHFTHSGGAGPVVVRWTITNGMCTTSATVSITIAPLPTSATTGPAKIICAYGTTTGLGGNTPMVGTGAWSVVSGGTGTFSDPAAPNATFTHTSGIGNIQLRWTITHGICSRSADLYVLVNPAPSNATVGNAQTICSNGTTAGLGGNTPVVGMGEWSIVSGGAGGSFSDMYAPNATYTHISGSGPMVLRWTIYNGTCSNSADVTITITPSPTPATVGASRTLCALGTTTGLGGNTPTVGTGEWSIVSGGTGTFSNVASPNSTFTHTTGAGPVVLRWTITNGACVSSSNLTVTIIPTPSNATVGAAQTICALGTTATLGGNDPAVGTGAWSIVSGGTGTFSNSATGASSFTHASGAGPVVLRWTTTNGACISSADVTINVLPAATPATTGGDRIVCALGTTPGLGGNTPTVGTGTWSLVSGGTGTFSNALSPTSTFTHTGGTGPILLRWTITNGSCPPSVQDLTVNVSQPPTTATAGSAQSICAMGTTVDLGGNTPTVGAGAWSVVSGGTGTFSNSSSPWATYTHTGGSGPVVLRWTITSLFPCNASTATVDVTILPVPTTATAGGAQTICALGTTMPLGGNTPTVGTGTWSISSGGTGIFSNAASPSSTFTHTGGNGPVVLRWVISNGQCSSFADVSVALTPMTTWYADTDGDGYGDPTVTIQSCTPPDGFVANNNDQCPLNAAKTAPGTCGCPNPEPGTACDDGSQATIEDVVNENCVCAGTPLGLAVRVKVFLEGPYNSTTGLMNDALRTRPEFPLTEPYNSSGATVQAGVLSMTGENAVVDWVLVELRMSANPAIVFSSLPGLLQRDGDVVAMDGVSTITFVWPAGDYHIAVRHRNHLGCMTALPVALSNLPTPIDFTLSSTATFGTQARKDIAGTTPAQVLWAGDVNFDGTLRYTGSSNDRDAILLRVGGIVPTATSIGYHREDINMDGVVRYTGTANDRDPILVNVGGTVPTAVRAQQLP